MTTLEALVLGLVQGLTEFLPVSSSGHLVVFETLFGIEGEGGLVFEVAVHVATLLAIVVVYRARILELARGALARDTEAWSYIAKLGLATLPAVAIGLGFKDQIEASFASPAIVGVCLIGTAAILWTTRATLPRATAALPSYAVAFGIGCAQAFAILPGISRSGTTVAAALALGVAPLAAAEFSFLLGTIAIAGAAVLILPDLGSADAAALPLAVGSAASLVAGIGAIVLFLRLLERRAFHAFAYYLVPAGAGFLAYLALRS